MDLLNAITLAVVQGLTEFLPISSSAHLIVMRGVSGDVAGVADPAFDVAVHVGTLAAVVLYFRRDLLRLTAGFFTSLRPGGKATPESRLAWSILLGTIPVGLAGLFGKDLVESSLRSTLVIALASIVFGVLLWLADARGARTRGLAALRPADVVVVGLAQCVALIPGASRSGCTMTGALAMGLTRDAAARFSFLLSIPVILLAGLLKGRDLVAAGDAVDWTSVLVGVGVSALYAYLCIEFFLRLLDRIGMTPFVIYRVLLGIALLAFWMA